MSFICGVFVPQSILSAGLLNVARFLPLYWMVCANQMAIDGVGSVIDTDKLFLCIGIELLFAVAFAVLAAMIKMTRVSRMYHS